ILWELYTGWCRDTVRLLIRIILVILSGAALRGQAAALIRMQGCPTELVENSGTDVGIPFAGFSWYHFAQVETDDCPAADGKFFEQVDCLVIGDTARHGGTGRRAVGWVHAVD